MYLWYLRTRFASKTSPTGSWILFVSTIHESSSHSVTVYIGRWNQRIEIGGLSEEYAGLYDGILLDEEIEKMVSWNNEGTPPHSEWVPCNSFQCTGESFGLIDPITVTDSGEEDDAVIENEADAVADHFLELDTGVTEDDALLNSLPESSRWLAMNFGRWRPSP